MTEDDIKKQALSLAKSNKEVEPQISAFYWFPNKKEIRLLEVENDIPKSLSGYASVFYFGPSPKDGLNAPCAIGLIRPEEVRKIGLPKGWDWKNSKKLRVV